MTTTADLLSTLKESTTQGGHVAVAVGAFGLIHAGTVEFLRKAGERAQGPLYAAVLAAPEQGDSTRLLRADERLRVLEQIEGVSAAALVEAEDLEVWHRAAPAARWASSKAEADIEPPVGDLLKKLGVDLAEIETTGSCTTQSLLARMSGA